MFKNKIVKTLSLILASAIIVSSSNIGLAFSEASPEQEIIIETESSDKIEEQEIEDIKSQENNENIEFTEIEEIPPETNNFEENIVSDNSNSEYIEEEIEAKTVYAVNFYNGEDIIFNCEVEEGGSFELPDMSNDETFVKWQLNGEDFDNNGYIVTDNIDIIGVFDVDVSDIKEEKPVFYEKEIEGYKVTVLGNIPEDNTVTIELVNDNILEYSINQTLPSEETFTAYATFDINIYDANGEKWQPMDYDEIVSIKVEKLEDRKEEALKGLFTFEYDKEGKIVKVSPITAEDVVDTVYRTSEGSVDELYVNSESEVGVECETEHFSTFTYGGITYNTTNATTTYTAGDNITAYWFEDEKTLAYIGTGELLSGALQSIYKSIKNVYFDDRITTIKSSAFSYCTNLALVKLPVSLTSIGERAFEGCTSLALTGSLPSGLTSIGNYAFIDCTNLALTGELPAGLTTIGSYAFSGCTNLALSGELPSGLTTIKGSAFEDCPNLALTGSLPSGLTTIGSFTFRGCTSLALTGELPSGLTSIGSDAFSGCANLALSGELPSGLTSIGSDAFYGCTKLALTGELPSGLTSIGTSAFYGCSNLALTGSLPSGLTYIGGSAFYLTAPEKTHFDKNLSSETITSDMYVPTSYTVTDTFTDGKKTDVITTKYGYVGATSSAGTALTYSGYTLRTDCTDAAITIGATDADRLSLTRAYEKSSTKVFTYNGKDYYDTDATTTYTAGDNITAYWYADDGVLGFVGTGAMYDWEYGTAPWNDIKINITDIYFLDEITSIGKGTFNGCSCLVSINALPSKLETIGMFAFDGCFNLTFAGSLPDTLTSIGEAAFQVCNKLALSGELPSGLTEIGENAFQDCYKLALAGELPSGLTSLERGVFQNCYDLAITGSLPSGLTAIGMYAFSSVDTTKTHFDQNLSSVDIASNMCIPMSYTITDTFEGGKPDVITTKYAFAGDTSSVGTAPTYEGYTLLTDCTDTTLSLGKNGEGKTNFNRSYAIAGSGYTGISWEIGSPTASDVVAKLYYYNKVDETEGYKLVWIGSGNTKDYPYYSGPIRNCAPWGSYSENIKEIEIRDGITSIGERAFAYCENLTDATLADSIKSIGKSAFLKTALINCNLPDNLEKISNGVFENCSSLTLTGELPSGLTSIGDYAFDGCTNLALTGSLPSGLTSIGSYAFDGCTNLALTGSLPSSLTSIGNYAFYKCTNLALTGELPRGLTVINNSIFSQCYQLKLSGTLPPNITKIGRDAFYQCKKVTFTGKIPSEVTEIGAGAFLWCYDVTFTGELPRGLTVLNNDIFNTCRNLQLSGTLPPNITEIGEEAFWNCKNLALTGEIPSTVTKIGARAFSETYNCTFSGSLPTGLKELCDNAFENTSKTILTGDIPAGIEKIGENVFGNIIVPSSHFDRNLSNIVITEDMHIPTSYTVVDTFTDGEKADVKTTKYSYVGNKVSAEKGPIHEGYVCNQATNVLHSVTIGSTDEDRLTLTRVYSPSSHTVTFDANGGYFNNDPTATTLTKTVEDNGIVGTLEEPTRERYTFKGWITSSTGESFDPNIDIITGDCTIKADWEIITYSIKFVDYDGCPIFSKKYNKGSPIEVPINNPTRTGYNFAGWTPSVSAVANSNITYTATYTPIPKTKYTIKFIDYDDKVLSNVEYDAGSIVSLPTSPIRDGYRFTGWSPTVNIKAVANATYKAEYEKDKKEDIPVPTEPAPIEPTPAPAPIPVVDKEDDPEPLPTPEKQEEKPLTPIQKLINAIDGGFRPEDTVEEEVKEETTEKKPVEEAKPTPETQPKTPSDEDIEPKSDITDTIKRAAVATLITGAVGVSLVATGGFNYLYMLLLCLLFKKRKVKFHGLLTNEENKFIKTRNMPEDTEPLQAIIDKHDTFAEAVEDIKGLEGETLLPPNTKMDISFIAEDGYEETHTYDANEDDMFKELEKFKDMDVLVNIYCNKAKVDIKLKFHL